MRRIAGESTVERRAKEVCERDNDPDPPPPELPSPENHGRTIRWLTRGGQMVVTSSGCRNPAHALAAAYADAVRQGYRRPRWWQLRRRLYEANYQRMLRATTAAYGKTKQGAYMMSEAQAKAEGARPDHGKACGS